ncbi:MAG: SUMF1/EgtB/PvdO family nonheme iron enzyme [Halioglobus sp.]|nr:SUMF1/EgtB/PvdO family nonheme iron enzyme [Halioglobus sp.]
MYTTTPEQLDIPTPARHLALALLLLLPPAAQGEAFEAFALALPGEARAIEMVPISGGSFVMGGPAGEAGRDASEVPQREVSVSDFWMSRFEIDWQQYELFVYRDDAEFNKRAPEHVLRALAIDGVTGATAPYADMSFGMGKAGYPAINITRYAAQAYARWLSARTGRFFRLPTEAEWEYACRAGTTTPWSFGADPGAMDEYAVHAGNSNGQYAPTGTRAANPLGLHDMHGNVAEWTLDQLATYAAQATHNPYRRPDALYPGVVRGGSWMDDPRALRCAARQPSAPEWKERDPQLPKSLWWHTNAPFVGFRLVAPRVQPPRAEIQKYWLDAREDYGI